ncbi:MAG: hydantoinase/oxoprolinase family protein [Hyphomicrobiaceae bacterium]
MLSIGIDTGGTFTDLAFYDGEEGVIKAIKVPSTVRDPSQAVLQVLGRLGEARWANARIIHGTTVGTNILLERRGADLAILGTIGFRDLLEIGRTKRTSPGLFNTKFVKSPPLVRRSRRFEIDERLGVGGTVVRSLSHDSVRSACQSLAEKPPEVVVICFLHSFANPAHELEARSLVQDCLPGVHVILSSDVVPEYREFERLTTSVINGYILPRVRTYLEQLERQIGRRGEKLYVMGSNGGILQAGAAAVYPARTILSGPAGGVNGALLTCLAAGIPDFITCDMGGTSTDVALIRNLEPTMVQESTIAGVPLKLPQLDINTVGAGGGSIAWVDIDGRLSVGPRSAGAEPGPACYGRGGADVTVTDANLLLGRLSPDTLLAGELKLDRHKSQRVMADLASRCRYEDTDRLAEGVIRLAVARMASAIREVSIERGHDPRAFCLIPLGGAGPLHAAELAKELGISQVAVPRFPGNLSAVGLISSDIRHDFARTMVLDARQHDAAALERLMADMIANARASLERDGFAQESARFQRLADMRYRGQAFDLTVPILDLEAGPEALIAKFEQLYAQRYGHNRKGKPIDIVTLRVVATGIVPRPAISAIRQHKGSVCTAKQAQRSVYFDGTWHHDCPVFMRDHLGSGFEIKGPALVEEYGSVTIVPPSWRMVVDGFGNLRLAG